MASGAPRGEGVNRLLSRIAGLATRHPRLVLAVWVAVVGLLAMQGRGLEDDLATKPIYIEGTATERAQEIVAREFGSEDAMIVMLRGPGAAVERQGPRLARRLGAMPHTLVVSPWDSRGAIDGLRPQPGVAALLVNTQSPGADDHSETVPAVRRVIAETVSGPVEVSVAGGPAILDSMRDSTRRASEMGQRLAIPVLLIVLLFVCRSFLAAALPVVLGAAVVAATRGVLDLLQHLVRLESFALGAAGMIGLALGVDYSLLVVARFREEMRKRDDVAEAVRETVVKTGRSVVPAGLGLLLAMLVASQLLPGSVVSSVAVAVAAATVLSVISAMFVAPALLSVFGARLDRWSLPSRGQGTGAVMRWSGRLSRRPALVLSLVFALVLCAGWAFTLDTKIGAAALLPPDDPGRVQQEDIQRALGPGWVAPIEVVMDGGEQPVTTPERLRKLSDFQRRVERDPGVATMAGFASFDQAAEQLGGVERGLGAQQRGLVRIDDGIERARGGSAATTDGLVRAAGGAGRLDAALAASRTGSGRLVAGLGSLADGSATLRGGLDGASAGSGELADATSDASLGARELAGRVRVAEERVEESAGRARVLRNALLAGQQALTGVEAPLQGSEAQLEAAWQALQAMTSGRGDPQYEAALAGVTAAIAGLTGGPPAPEEGADPEAGVGAGVRQAQNQFELGLYLADTQAKQGGETRAGIAELARGSDRLDRGLRRLLARTRQLSAGIVRLSEGSEEIPSGLERLALGAQRLSGGLGEAQAGAGELAGRLGSGAQQSRLLTGGLERIHSGLERQSGDSRLAQLRRRSPGLFRSGYFYLAGFDGSRPGQRNQADLLVNLDRGGFAARMLVIPRDDVSSAGTRATTERLRDDAAELAEETGAEVLVGGFAPATTDIDTALRESAPGARVALSLVTILVILLVTRSLALALLAALLNLLTVSATFGLLALLFDGSLLGGPGFVDSSILAAAVILVFGLAIDYEVFIFARMREEYLRTGSTAEAIANGLGRTAHVVTGAALIMIAVFLAFAISPLATIRNLGVGLAIAIFIDAFLIRFVVVPATMRALGDRSWWIPRWLDRLLPGGPAPTAPRAVEA